MDEKDFDCGFERSQTYSDEKMEEERVNRLLVPIFERYDLKRKALLEQFKDNGNRFDEKILFQLISDDLSLREELGEELLLEYTKGNVSKEELLKRQATVGQGVLWSGEASIGIVRIDRYEIKEEGGIYLVKIRCTMDRIGGHEVSESEPSQEFPAEIVAEITDELEVDDIRYNDRLLPGTGWMRLG